ncbi:MAG: hypothetical protein WBW81_10765 [Methylocella sp.]
MPTRSGRPIPDASPEQAANIARRARKLQESHTARRDKLVGLAKRMETIQRRAKPETWLFPNLTSKRELEPEAPPILDTEGRRAWAAKQYGDAPEALHEAIGQRLNPGAALDAAFADGELSFSIDGVTVIDRVFESEAEGTFILAQWKVLAATLQITERTAGKRLCGALRKLTMNDGSPVVLQIVALERELASLDAEIVGQEREMNALVYALYSLSAEEIEMVEKG